MLLEQGQQLQATLAVQVKVGTAVLATVKPDATGIGTWKLENFKRALREGKSKGLANARTLLPPMPWPNYAEMPDQDVAAIFAYMRSLPPVRNIVPAPLLPAGSPAVRPGATP